MSLLFTVAEPWLLLFFLLLLFLIIFFRYQFYRPIFYLYPLASYLKKNKFQASSFYSSFFFYLRVFLFFLLVLLIAKPQIEDEKSNVNEDGIDIVLDLDVSGSMDNVDNPQLDRRSRFQIAKSSALEFVKKRVHDSIGLVIFGAYSVKRVPMIFDKGILKEIIDEINLHSLDKEILNGTAIYDSIVASCRTLENSKAKSKIIVLLTDGVSNQGIVDIETAIGIAKKVGVKIYTIGFGTANPFFGGMSYDENSLRAIASHTGGSFFKAKNSKDLDKVYEEIDKLEKVSHEVKIYSKYHDFFIPFLIFVLGLALFELIMATFVWFIL